MTLKNFHKKIYTIYNKKIHIKNTQPKNIYTKIHNKTFKKILPKCWTPLIFH